MNESVGAVRREERLLFGGALFIYVLTALYSAAPFHPDEYFQVLEWTGFKLGYVPSAEMPWEHGAMIRPWLMPWIFWILAKGWISALGTNFFVFATFLRVISALGSFAAFYSTYVLSRTWLPRERFRAHAFIAATAGFLPYLAARTSGENWGTSFFLFAFIILARTERPTFARSFLAGALLGLSFECRYQMAFLALGLLAHRLSSDRRARGPWRGTLAGVSLGGILTLGASAFIDRWGYGTWVFPPLAYLRTNILEGRAATFGTDPVFAFFYLVVANIFFPVALVTVLTLVLLWVRHPKHVLTWTTLPFFVLHSLIGHKEERFLFPLAPLVVVGAVLAWSAESSVRLRRLSTAAARLRGVARVIWVHQVAVMLFLAFVPFGWRPNVGLSRAIVEQEIPVPLEIRSRQRFQEYYFLQRGKRLFQQAQEGDWTARGYVVTRSPGLSEIDGHAVTLVMSEAPFGSVSFADAVRRASAWARAHVGGVPEIGCPSLYRVEQVRSK